MSLVPALSPVFDIGPCSFTSFWHWSL